MLKLRAKLEDTRSEWYRGMLTQHTDAGKGLAIQCIPYMGENCDPDSEDHFIEYFLYCIAGSFGFLVLVIILYKCCTRGRKRIFSYRTLSSGQRAKFPSVSMFF